MKKICVIVALAVMTGCKKNYTCECRNQSAVYTAGETYATKNNAEEKCKSLSAGDTNCYLQ